MNQQKQRSQNKVNCLALNIPRSSNGRTRRFERWNGGSNPSLGELNDTRAGFRSALVPCMHIIDGPTAYYRAAEGQADIRGFTVAQIYEVY